MNKNILFLTLVQISSIKQKGIYSDLLRKFSLEGYNVFIVCPLERRLKKQTFLITEGNVKILNVRTLNIQKTNAIEKGFSTLWIEYFFRIAIEKYFNGIKFNLILYSTPPITLTNLIIKLKIKYGASTYLLLKDIFPQNAVDLSFFSKSSFIFKFFKRKEKELYRISDNIGCMSPKNVSYLLEHNPELNPQKVEVNPNSIELTDVLEINKREIFEKYSIPSNKVLFIYGGNLGKPQGIDFVISVLESNKNNEDCCFVIVGDGTEFQKLHKWQSNNINSNLILIKQLPQPEFQKILYCAHVGMIFLDHRFTIPNYPSRLLSYLEAKIPVILATDINTDIGHIAETNNFGLWSISGDLNSFNANLESLVKNEKSRIEMGQRGYDFLKEYYHVNHTFSLIEEKMHV